ncbi:MAG: ATP synthase F1 subunit delta [Fimbriimonadaceae bacterium]|nr:ATP synthase F1 subunit delta [Chitinophagales bacterium]
MSAIKLASRYAKSILDLAIEKGQLEVVMDDMKSLNYATDNSREFYLMLKSPIVNGDKKMEVTKLIFGGKLSTMTVEFINILMRKNRESYLPEIIDAFIKQYNHYKNITEVKVTTAQPISDELQNEILHRLRSQAGLKEIELTTTIDDSLIGGYVLQWEDKLIDTSIARGLAILKDEFDNNDYVRKF